jgi:hypothetical protein
LSATSDGQPRSITRPKEKIRIVELCRREGIAASTAAQAATTDEVKRLRREAQYLKEVARRKNLVTGVVWRALSLLLGIPSCPLT